MSSAIVPEIQLKISYAYYLYNCFFFMSSEQCKIYYYKTHVTSTHLVIIHSGESRQTLCAFGKEIQVHIPIETVILFLS